jgi:hypothetical protein
MMSTAYTYIGHIIYMVQAVECSSLTMPFDDTILTVATISLGSICSVA